MGNKESSTGRWIEANVPLQEGKTIIITGSNSGIGFEAARVLASKGARIIMGCRNLDKSREPFERVKESSPAGSVELIRLDLADFKSVREFAAVVREGYDAIDALVNNAGIMAPPYGKTVEGFEQQWGINHLGHFLLTGLLLDMVTTTPRSRIVTITSIAHFNGMINFNDLNSEQGYNRMKAYRQSKLANLVFAYELQRRLLKSGSETISLAVHPGISATSIIDLPPLIDKLKDAVLMSSLKGSLPTVMGVTAGELKGGEYIGPDGFRQAFGFPAVLQSNRLSHDPGLAARLWDVSEELTGLKYKF